MPAPSLFALPDDRELAAEPVLALLAAADAVLVVLARALRVSQPEIDKAPRPSDGGELAAAREIVELADLLLYQIELLGDTLRDRLRRPPRHDWHF